MADPVKPTIDVTDSVVFIALRAVLVIILPTGVEVIKGQVNRVPEPGVNDFVVMTPIGKERIETNIDYFVGDISAGLGKMTSMAPTNYHIQLDVHGPNSSDNSQLITTLFRDDFGVSLFNASNPNVTPLYCEAPKQIPFLNENQQIEQRWVVDAHIQINPTLTTSQESADVLGTFDTVNVDVVYPP